MPVRILIADDNEIARALLRDVLKARPEWVICGEAFDGKEAIQKALELKPDVILMDLAMPNMDGITAARGIRKLLPQTSVLLVSLHNIPQMELMAKAAGIERVVIKSEADTALVLAIEATLNERAASAAGKAEAATAGTTQLASGSAAETSGKGIPGSEPEEENGGPQAN